MPPIEIDHESGTAVLWYDGDAENKKTVGPGKTWDEIQSAIADFEANKPKEPEQ